MKDGDKDIMDPQFAKAAMGYTPGQLTGGPGSLAGQFLIAMPGMADPRFARAVIYLCAHTPENAMGLVINKPLQDLKFVDVLENLNIIPGKFPNQTVYFALDSHQVRDSERMKVEAVAAAMTTEPNLYLIIEGHCDERGTEEYNRALGSQRALSLREELVKAGISGQRILTETYGEDRPAVQGHDEAAWSKNRRGEFVAGTLKEVSIFIQARFCKGARFFCCLDST